MHSLCYAIFATRGSYTAPHVDFFGTDAYLHLVSGEKLWFLAPPEHKAAFMRLFKRDNRGATIRLSKKQKKLMEQHNMSFIHQRAGDAVFVPAGWPHMVKNLSDTVSFGNSYLRPWNMPRFLAFVKHPKQGLEKCSRLLNVRGIIEAWMSEQRQREWGVTPDQAEDVMRKWGQWISEDVMPAEEPTGAGGSGPASPSVGGLEHKDYDAPDPAAMDTSESPRVAAIQTRSGAKRNREADKHQPRIPSSSKRRKANSSLRSTAQSAGESVYMSPPLRPLTRQLAAARPPLSARAASAGAAADRRRPAD